jgi:hypothetical protein
MAKLMIADRNIDSVFSLDRVFVHSKVTCRILKFNSDQFLEGFANPLSNLS